MLFDTPYCEDDFDGFFDEPSEYDEIVEELKTKLKQSVRKELMEKLERLSRENAELKEIKDRWDEKCSELEADYRKAVDKLEEERRTIKRKKARELLEVLSVELWGIDWKREYLPKCDRCDDRRRIITKRPQGNIIVEYCSCGRTRTVYSVRSSKPVVVYFHNRHGEITHNAYYAFNDDGECRPIKANIRDNTPFDEIETKYDAAFTTREQAQAYCDWLNEKSQWNFEGWE